MSIACDGLDVLITIKFSKETIMSRKILIVFYSRTGVTLKACSTLAKALDSLGASATCEEIVDHKDRSGLGGYVIAGKDAAMKKSTSIDAPKNNPADYDLLVLAMPVWAFTMPPAIRAYLEQTQGRLPEKIAAICTEGGSGDKKTCANLEKIIGRPLLATLALIDKKIKADSAEEFIGPINGFAEKLLAI
jgi:flavodoxin